MYALRMALKKVAPPGSFLSHRIEDVQRLLWKRGVRFFDYKQNMSTISIYLTTRCSLSCTNCDRAVSLAPGEEPISVDQVRRFVDESLRLSWEWRSIRLMGGEPTLHPEFDKILEVLAPYREAHPACEITVMTSGFGPRVQRDLARLPDNVAIRNSGKTSSRQRFQSYMAAPVDDERFRGADFTRGCYIIEYCGLELTSHGYYTCGAGGAVDRVFGLDVGLPSLESMTDGALKEQREKLCRFCGHYKYNLREEWTSEEVISPTWRDALARYRANPPALRKF